MSARRPLLVLGGCTLAGAILGTVAGGLIGEYAPTYYFEVFNAWDNPDFDPLQMGLGLGCVQGGGAGLAIGVGLILVTTWWKTSMTEPTEDWPWPTQTLAGRWGPVVAALFITGCLTATAGFVAGMTAAGHSSRTVNSLLRNQRALTGSQRLMEQIADQPEFSRVRLLIDDDGFPYFKGAVPSEEARAELAQQLGRRLNILDRPPMHQVIVDPETAR